MERIVEEKHDEITLICDRFYVRSLDVFGSATTGEFNPDSSDLDFLVTFRDGANGGLSHPYFDLHEALEYLFERNVDLVMESAIDNPYFREGVEETRVSVYAA